MQLVGLVDIPPGERRLLAFLVARSYNARWTIYGGNSVGDTLACQMGWDRRRVTEALRGLEKRGWVRTYANERGQPNIHLTKALLCEAEWADHRFRVRNAVGWKLWADLNGTDELADEIAEEADKLTEGRWNHRLQNAARRVLRDRGGLSPRQEDEPRKTLADFGPRTPTVDEIRKRLVSKDVGGRE